MPNVENQTRAMIVEVPSDKGRKPRRRKVTRPDLTHWPKAWELTVRAARNDEGEAIHALLDAQTTVSGWRLPKVRWDRVAPFWYVAEIQGVLLGAVQICIGWPVGRIELLAVLPGLSKTKRAKVVKALSYHVFAAMRLDGTELAAIMLMENGYEFGRILERWGARYAVQGKVYFYRLAGQE